MNMLRRWGPFAILLALLAATWAAFRVSGPIVAEQSLPVADLPEQVGEWHGAPVWFCQNEQCGRAVTGESGAIPEGGCPACGGPLDVWSPGERASLPEGTTLVRLRYQHPQGAVLMAAVVVSAPNQNSIHRPQTCLLGQGYRILRTTSLAVPLPQRPPLRLTVLELQRPGRLPNGELGDTPSYYAYWFVSRSRETAHHLALDLYTVFDRVIHGRLERWAYVALAGSRTPGSATYHAQIREFVQALYPMLKTAD